MAKAAPRANHDKLPVTKNPSPRKRLPSQQPNSKKSPARDKSASKAPKNAQGVQLVSQPELKDLESCFIRTKAEKLKKRFAYVVQGQIHMTYLDHENESLVVVLSLDLSKSHAILEEPRKIEFYQEMSTT